MRKRDYYQRNKEKVQEYARDYYQENKGIFKNKYESNKVEKREYSRKRSREHYHSIRKNNPAAYLFKKARDRAKAKDLPFNITVDDIIIPELCPVFGVPLAMGTGRPTGNSPSLDRINNNLGYIKGNVIVISYRANQAKSNMTTDELTRFANWILQVVG